MQQEIARVRQEDVRSIQVRGRVWAEQEAGHDVSIHLKKAPCFCLRHKDTGAGSYRQKLLKFVFSNLKSVTSMCMTLLFFLRYLNSSSLCLARVRISRHFHCCILIWTFYLEAGKRTSGKCRQQLTDCDFSCSPVGECPEHFWSSVHV